MSQHKHHILPIPLAIKILVTLLVLTVITVWASRMDFGRMNFVVAMLIATVKAGLVVSFFMGLKYDSNDNRAIFLGSFIFVGIFFILASSDILFRGGLWRSNRAEWNQLTEKAGGAKSKFKQPWKQTPEILAHGKAVFAQNCATCHGDAGHGDGPASGSLNPKPRNFTQGSGWKKARKVTRVFETVTNGLPGTSMSSFSTLSPDDRWGAAQYVLSLGPKAEADADADFKAIGVDPTKEGGGTSEKPTLPIDFTIERMKD